MNKIIYIILLSISFILMINPLFAEDFCYKANKNNFKQISNTSYDIIFDLSNLKSKNWIYLSFVSALPIPYADGKFGYYCTKQNKTSNTYECSGDCDSGHMTIRLDDYDLEVNVEYARLTNTPDDPIMHEIKSKKNKFTRTSRTVCPKPYILQNTQENYLPYVCYTWKAKNSKEAKKTMYHGCIRHNKVCKSIKAQHFGKYLNDHASYNALLRCENSNLLTSSDTSFPAVTSHTFIKSEKKKQALMDAINIKDISIYDLNYYDDLVIAVGEDDSEETRKLQTMDEHHEAVIVRSLDGGKTWSKIGKELESSVPHNTVIVLDSKRIVIASSIEGAGGFIVLSEDSGDTWEERYNEAFIESMKHIKGDTIVAKTTVHAIKSIDGGKNWTEVP